MYVSPNSAARSAACLFAAGIAALAAPAAAQDGAWEAGDFSAKVSVVGFLLDSEGEIALAGQPFQGAGAEVGDGVTAAIDLEYFVTDNLSVAVNFGIPIETDITGTGVLAGAGTLGSVDYGIGATTLRYHFDLGGAVSPYIGAGAGKLFIFDEKDALVSNLDVKGAWAPVVQAGVNIFVTRNVGIYANASYAPLDTEATGLALGAPATVDMQLNPTVVQGGVLYRF